MVILPSQTAFGGLVKPQTIIPAVRRAELDLPLPPVVTPGKNTLSNCYMVTPREEHEDIPTFTQIVNIGEPDKPRLVVDSRQYMKYDHRNGTYNLIAHNDWQFQCVRMALTMRLLEGDSTFFSRLTDLPVKVFHRWVAGALIQKYSLGVEQQMAMYVICAFYFYAMCNPELARPSEARERFSPIIARTTGVPIDTVLDVVEQIGKLETGRDLAHELSTNGRTIRMGTLKFEDLFALLASSWFGVNSRENVGVALEHVPTFVTMLYMGIAERSYRKTVITQRVDSVTRGSEQEVFVDLVAKAVTEQFTV